MSPTKRPAWAGALLVGLMALLTVLALAPSAAVQGPASNPAQRVAVACGGEEALATGPLTCPTTRLATDQHAVVLHVRPELQRHHAGQSPDDTNALKHPGLVAVAPLPGGSPQPLLAGHCADDRTRAPPLSGV